MHFWIASLWVVVVSAALMARGWQSPSCALCPHGPALLQVSSAWGSDPGVGVAWCLTLCLILSAIFRLFETESVE